ncbi:MAG: hypothetical protein O7D94_11190 [Planctomycetota bacterium]|nr:hypothetical protein [Planctomycetota bacterium]
MPELYFCCHPWDVLEDGLEETLVRLAGEIGVDSLSVPAIHGRIEQFRPRYQRPWIRREAAATFQPSSPHYGNTRIRPIPGAWMKTRNVFEQLTRACEKHRIAMRARVACCNGETTAARFRMATCVDVFGESSLTRLCPSNPDVREYVQGLIADLTENYEPASIELEGLDFGVGPFDSAECARGIAWGRTAHFLRSLCFCAACRQRASDAGVDADSVAHTVRDRLNCLFELGSIGFATPEALVEDNRELRSWTHLRRETVLSLLRSIRERSRSRLLTRYAGEALIRGAGPADLLEYCDALVCPPPADHDASHGRGSRSSTGDFGDPRRIDVQVYCHPPHMPDGPTLVRTVQRLSQAGHPAIGFSSYGLAPKPCLDWVRQAIRYTRRESTEA